MKILPFPALMCVFVVGCSPPPQDGRDGRDGTDGTPGANGSSCTVTPVENGALISCEDGSSAFVSDGVDGVNGIAGVDGKDAVSCQMINDVVQGYSTIECEDGTSLVIQNYIGCPKNAHVDVFFVGQCACDPGYDKQILEDGKQICVEDACMAAGKYANGICDDNCPVSDPECFN